MSICHWSPINTNIIGNAPIDVKINPTSDSLVAQEAANYLTNNDPDVMFLHFDDVDHAGHNYGFYPTVPQYTDAINYVDRQIGYVLTALQNRPNLANEDWVILVTTDHGGANGHGGYSEVERNIFFILSRAGQSPMEIKKSLTVQNSNCMPDTLGLNMQGTGDYVSVANHAAFQFGDTVDFTLELRIKTNGWNGDPSFMGNKNWNSGSNDGFVIAPVFGSGSNWKVNVGDGSNRADVNGGTINDNLWHHLAATFDRDCMLTLYQDGVETGATSMANVGNIDNTLALGIGQDGTLSYGSGMDGFLGEARIWRTLVDSSTLAAWQCQPLNNTHPNYGNLAGYWPMNEGTGTTLTDYGPNNLTGTYAGSTADWQAVNTLDTLYDWSNTPRQVDVAVTAMTHLCIPIDPAWNLDGKPVGLTPAQPAISGPDQVCQLDHDFYTVNAASGHPVSWTVTNGLILQGQDSTTVKVQWGGAGPGQVWVNECNASDTLEVTISICSDREAENLAEFFLYPNPVSTTSGNPTFIVEVPASGSDTWNLGLLDMTGRKLLTDTFRGIRAEVECPLLSTGIYIVEIQRGGQTFRQRLVVRQD